MKKLLSVLLIVMLAASVFAAAASNIGNKVTVKSVVGKITINDANDKTALYTLFVDTDKSDYISDNDISQEDVTADFRIVQNNKTATNESIDLSVTVDKLSLEEHTSGDVTIYDVLGTNDNCLKVSNSNPTDGAVTFTVRYQGSANPVMGGTQVASFSAKWAKNTDLNKFEGTYSADITLAYTTT